MNISKKKKTTKKFIVKKLKKLVDYELTYDLISDDENADYKSAIERKKFINFDLIKTLPKLKTKVNECVLNLSEKDYLDDDSNIEDCVNKLDTDGIDISCLVKDNIAGKIIYYDFDRNMIYDQNYIVIGSISDDGEIYIEDVNDSLKSLIENKIDDYDNVTILTKN